jgi:hypothetical protein
VSGKNKEQARAAAALLELVRLHEYAEMALGAKAWRLLSRYGRVISGRHSGQYVSGIPSDEVRKIVDSLAQGEIVHIHLMHTHRSGEYRASALRFDGTQLWMVYDDREVLAQLGPRRYEQPSYRILRFR